MRTAFSQLVSLWGKEIWILYTVRCSELRLFIALILNLLVSGFCIWLVTTQMFQKAWFSSKFLLLVWLKLMFLLCYSGWELCHPQDKVSTWCLASVHTAAKWENINFANNITNNFSTAFHKISYSLAILEHFKLQHVKQRNYSVFVDRSTFNLWFPL